MDFRRVVVGWASGLTMAFATLALAQTEPQKDLDPVQVLTNWAAKREGGADAKRLPMPPVALTNQPVLGKLFPDLVWCSMSGGFRPVAQLQEPWPPRSLFTVDRTGGVTYLTEAKALEDFFRGRLPVVKTEADARAAVEAWLILSQTLQNHVQFPVDVAGVKATSQDGGIWMAEGQAGVQIEPGKMSLKDVGYVKAKLTFGGDGKCQAVVTDVKVRPGVRPICQSTKLLDPDPIVRTMAETELRLMGRQAEEYLKYQRARSTPDIQAAIDRMWQQILDDEAVFGK